MYLPTQTGILGPGFNLFAGLSTHNNLKPGWKSRKAASQQGPHLRPHRPTRAGPAPGPLTRAPPTPPRRGGGRRKPTAAPGPRPARTRPHAVPWRPPPPPPTEATSGSRGAGPGKLGAETSQAEPAAPRLLPWGWPRPLVASAPPLTPPRPPPATLPVLVVCSWESRPTGTPLVYLQLHGFHLQRSRVASLDETPSVA